MHAIKRNLCGWSNLFIYIHIYYLFPNFFRNEIEFLRPKQRQWLHRHHSHVGLHVIIIISGMKDLTIGQGENWKRDMQIPAETIIITKSLPNSK